MAKHKEHIKNHLEVQCKAMKCLKGSQTIINTFKRMIAKFFSSIKFVWYIMDI